MFESWKKQTYSCGTLNYTMKGVIVLFCWLLWGDFCLTLFERVRPTIVPLILKMHDASNLTIGLLCGTIPALLNFIVNPIISTASDRTRSRWGRRIPYLLFAVPFVSLFLILLGFSDSIGTGLARLISGPDASPGKYIIAVVSFFSVGFCFFDLFAGCVYYYLFSDVVPQPLMGRFMGFFRVAGNAGGLVFSLLAMPYVLTHMTLICVITALIYFVGFGGMCLHVREGEYPPPPPAGDGLGKKIAGYFKECFSIPFFLIFFLGFALNYASTVCRSLFGMLQSLEIVHLTTAQVGFFGALSGILGMCLSIPVGFLIDKFHPIRIYIAGGWLIVITNIFAFFFCYTYYTALLFAILFCIVYVLQNSAALPLVICIFPKEKFGQFSSANALCKSIMLIACNSLGGWFIDLLGYQYIFIWDLMFTFAVVLIFHWVYSRWKKLGGDTAYVPPIKA